MSTNPPSFVPPFRYYPSFELDVVRSQAFPRTLSFHYTMNLDEMDSITRRYVDDGLLSLLKHITLKFPQPPFHDDISGYVQSSRYPKIYNRMFLTRYRPNKQLLDLIDKLKYD